MRNSSLSVKGTIIQITALCTSKEHQHFRSDTTSIFRIKEKSIKKKPAEVGGKLSSELHSITT